MNKTHSSRKQQIEMMIKMEIFAGHIKNAVDIAEKYNITPKRVGKLAAEVENYRN